VSNSTSALKNKVWFTFKARIVAHEMLVFKNNLTQVLLVWYSFLLLTSSIVMIRYPKFFGDDGDIMIAVLSLFVLALSLIVSNRDYRGREKDMRSNYLNLQSLYREIECHCENEIEQKKLSEWDARYQRALEHGENHSTYHDLCQRIRADGLTSRKPTKTDYLNYYISFSGKSALVVLVMSLPVLLLVSLGSFQ
jgi:hypothetical protein